MNSKALLSSADLMDRLLRVDLAGERGAMRIYEGQLWVLKKKGAQGRKEEAIQLITQMYQQECAHVQAFEKLAKAHHVRPTFLAWLWHVGGWALGAGTALLGTKAAMACTAAVEHVIDAHYSQQIACLDEDQAPLAEFLEKCRQEEAHHHDTAMAFGAQEAVGYPVLSAAIRGVTRVAIKLSEIF